MMINYLSCTRRARDDEIERRRRIENVQFSCDSSFNRLVSLPAYNKKRTQRPQRKNETEQGPCWYAVKLLFIIIVVCVNDLMRPPNECDYSARCILYIIASTGTSVLCVVLSRNGSSPSRGRETLAHTRAARQTPVVIVLVPNASRQNSGA